MASPKCWQIPYTHSVPFSFEYPESILFSSHLLNSYWISEISFIFFLLVCNPLGRPTQTTPSFLRQVILNFISLWTRRKGVFFSLFFFFDFLSNFLYKCNLLLCTEGQVFLGREWAWASENKSNEVYFMANFMVLDSGQGDTQDLPFEKEVKHDDVSWYVYSGHLCLPCTFAVLTSWFQYFENLLNNSICPCCRKYIKS